MGSSNKVTPSVVAVNSAQLEISWLVVAMGEGAIVMFVCDGVESALGVEVAGMEVIVDVVVDTGAGIDDAGAGIDDAG